MKNVSVKKTFAGKISIRDYIVKKAIKDGESITVSFDNLEMVLAPDELKYFTCNNYVFSSKHNTPAYKLYDYDWKPSHKWTYNGNVARQEVLL